MAARRSGRRVVAVAISEEDWSVVQGWLRELRAAGVVEAEQTQALLQQVSAAYNTRVNDVLLTALGN